MLSQEEIDKYVKAGKICSQARAYGVSLIKVGASNLEVSQAVEAKIKELGGEPAFPTQISVNHIAAHFCPDPDDESVFNEGDMCKLDLGVHVDGYIADTAITVYLQGKDSSEEKEIKEKLVRASLEACEEALKIVKPGTKLREIGKVIHSAITSYGFAPIRNLSGHGLDKYVIHDKPTVPNYDNGDETELKEGMVIAIEPFATTGRGLVQEQDRGNIYSEIKKKSVRSPYARAVQKEIEQFNNLPFTTHQLKTPHRQAEFGLRELATAGCLEVYPPLVEGARGIVSQHEHSVIVTKDGAIVYTR